MFSRRNSNIVLCRHHYTRKDILLSMTFHKFKKSHEVILHTSTPISILIKTWDPNKMSESSQSDRMEELSNKVTCINHIINQITNHIINQIINLKYHKTTQFSIHIINQIHQSVKSIDHMYILEVMFMKFLNNILFKHKISLIEIKYLDRRHRKELGNNSWQNKECFDFDDCFMF